MKKSILFVEIVFLLFHYSSIGVEAVDCNLEPKNNEGRIKKAIFCNYDKSARPTLNDGAIKLKFKMIVKAFNFDSMNNKLTVSSWLAMSWTDDHLKWNPSDYNNMMSITEASENFWQPDLALYNSDVASSHNEFCKMANCVISSNGMVSCIPPCSHDAKCLADYTRFPFDTQNCTLHIGTWVNSGEEIDFKVLKTVISQNDLSSQDRQYKIIKATYKRNAGNFTDTKDTYPSLTFAFLIQRHSAVHGAILIVAAFSLAAINMLSLWVDPDNNTRMILLSISLYGHFEYVRELVWYVPSNGDIVPDIFKYYRDSMLITSLLIIGSIIVRGMSTCGIQVPNWIENTTTYVGSNRVGQLLLTKHLIERQTLNNESGTDDDINLVESQETEKPMKKGSLWRTFGKIIDRILFTIFTIVYIIMMLSLLPEGYFDRKDEPNVEIIGY